MILFSNGYRAWLSSACTLNKKFLFTQYICMALSMMPPAKKCRRVRVMSSVLSLLLIHTGPTLCAWVSWWATRQAQTYHSWKIRLKATEILQINYGTHHALYLKIQRIEIST